MGGEILKPTQVLATERRSEKQSAIHKPLVVAERKRVIALQHKCFVSTAGAISFTHQRVSEFSPETLALEPTVWAPLIIIFPAIDSLISCFKCLFFFAFTRFTRIIRLVRISVYSSAFALQNFWCTDVLFKERKFPERHWVGGRGRGAGWCTTLSAWQRLTVFYEVRVNLRSCWLHSIRGDKVTSHCSPPLSSTEPQQLLP